MKALSMPIIAALLLYPFKSEGGCSQLCATKAKYSSQSQARAAACCGNKGHSADYCSVDHAQDRSERSYDDGSCDLVCCAARYATEQREDVFRNEISPQPTAMEAVAAGPFFHPAIKRRKAASAITSQTHSPPALGAAFLIPLRM